MAEELQAAQEVASSGEMVVDREQRATALPENHPLPVVGGLNREILLSCRKKIFLPVEPALRKRGRLARSPLPYRIQDISQGDLFNIITLYLVL